MKKSTFEITKMDCPSEENLIKMKLDGQSNIKKLEFDIPNRKLFIYHKDNIELIGTLLNELNLGSKLISTENSFDTNFIEEKNQKKLLLTVLIINLLFFFIEIIFGIVSKSMGLVADSLDMLADSFVYGISIIAIGGTISRKKTIAKLAGYIQISLAIIGFSEVIRRFIFNEKIPDFWTMIIVSVFALIANSICLLLMQKSKVKKEAHIQASMIFTSNDVIINLGVIIAAIFVHIFNSQKPDLIIGALVFILVIRGAKRILKLSK